MLIVAGLSLKNLEPRVWDPKSRFYLSSLPAVMVSYGEFHQMQSRRRTAMDLGLRAYLGVPREVKVYLDNGAFYFASQAGEAPLEDYERFSEEAKPDWKPIPQDYIPLPGMTPEMPRKLALTGPCGSTFSTRRTATFLLYTLASTLGNTRRRRARRSEPIQEAEDSTKRDRAQPSSETQSDDIVLGRPNRPPACPCRLPRQRHSCLRCRWHRNSALGRPVRF